MATQTFPIPVTVLIFISQLRSIQISRAPGTGATGAPALHKMILEALGPNRPRQNFTVGKLRHTLRYEAGRKTTKNDRLSYRAVTVASCSTGKFMERARQQTACARS